MKVDAAITLAGLDTHPHLSELPGAAALLFVSILGFAVATDGLAEGNLWCGEVDLDVEPLLQSLHGDLQMQFALPGDNGLVEFGIDVVLE